MRCDRLVGEDLGVESKSEVLKFLLSLLYVKMDETRQKGTGGFFRCTVTDERRRLDRHCDFEGVSDAVLEVRFGGPEGVQHRSAAIAAVST